MLGKLSSAAAWATGSEAPAPDAPKEAWGELSRPTALSAPGGAQVAAPEISVEKKADMGTMWKRCQYAPSPLPLPARRPLRPPTPP